MLKLEYEDRPLLSMVLVAVPSLEQALANDPVLARRAAVKVRIAPLDAENTAAYLNHRIQRVHGNPEIFEAAAVLRLGELGGGMPGLINTLADNALFEAFLCGRKRVSSIDIERVYADLGWELSPQLLGAAPEPPQFNETLQPAAGDPGGHRPQAEVTSRVGQNSTSDGALTGPPKLEELEADDELLVELIDD